MAREIPSRIQNSCERPPLWEPIITARIISTAVSVSIVPPTVIATSCFFEIPSLLTIGMLLKCELQTYLLLEN